MSEADDGAELAEALTQLKKEDGGEEVSYRLTDSRRKRLEEIGFVWSARDGEKGTEIGRITRNSYDDQWDVMFEKLEEYKKFTGVRLWLPFDFIWRSFSCDAFLGREGVSSQFGWRLISDDQVSGFSDRLFCFRFI
jgi:hypothetical protein